MGKGGGKREGRRPTSKAMGRGGKGGGKGEFRG